MAEFKVIRATQSDVCAVRNLTRIAYAPWVPIIEREPLPMLADYSKAITEHIIDMHEESGELVALIEMIPCDKFLMIENVAVHPNQQRRGFGGLLLAHAEDVARALGLAEMRLYTNAKFASSISLYLKCGYHETLREPFNDGGVVVYMSKLIV